MNVNCNLVLDLGTVQREDDDGIDNRETHCSDNRQTLLIMYY